MKKKIRKMLLGIAFIFVIGFVAGSICTMDASAATLSTKAEKAYKNKIKAIKKNAAKKYTGWTWDSYKIVFYFLDVDGDGQKEMLVQDIYDMSSVVPAKVYKYKGGKVVCLLKVGSGNDSWWNFKFCRYYSKTKTLVFGSSHTTGTPTTYIYYKWDGKKFVKKVKQVYYEANKKASMTYKTGSAALIKKLEKGSCKKAGSLTLHKY